MIRFRSHVRTTTNYEKHSVRKLEDELTLKGGVMLRMLYASICRGPQSLAECLGQAARAGASPRHLASAPSSHGVNGVLAPLCILDP
jgi:hypothetical protein